MRRFIRKSFKRELLLSYIVVALLPLVLSSVFLIQMFKMKIDSDYRKKDMEQAQEMEKRLTGLFQKFSEISEGLAGDPALKTDLKSHESGDGKNKVYETLYNETAGIRGMARFDLYSGDGICRYSTGVGMIHTRLPVYWGILKAAAAHPDKTVIRRGQELNDSKGILLNAARVLKDEQGKTAGYVVISMDEADFEGVLKGSWGSQDGICIVDAFWETVYQTGNGASEHVGEVMRNRLLSGEGPLEEYHNNRLYYMPIGDTGLFAILLRPDVFTKDTTKTMYSVMLIIAFISLLLCTAVANRMSNSFTRPVKSLNLAMGRVQEGDLETRIESSRADELGQLSDSFNTMTERLKTYMEKQVGQQKQMNEIQAAMMSAQLNPHFLYNTLDTMKWVAKANHIPEIATLASRLAKILRASISQVQFITLQEEMNLVESYAKIQEIRFQGRFSFEYELGEDVKNCRIPKLIVQPIVENSVIHGLADCEEGHITVQARRDSDRLYIEVTDDGCGISREMMDMLNSRDKEKLKGHLGFYNVDTIIRLHYGEEYGLRACALACGSKGKGTRVVIVLPAEPGEEVEDV